jgi:hypothetical protein
VDSDKRGCDKWGIKKRESDQGTLKRDSDTGNIEIWKRENIYRKEGESERETNSTKWGSSRRKTAIRKAVNNERRKVRGKQ